MPKNIFKPGNNYGGGRPKGSKNKINYNVAEICDELDCNPFEVLALVSNGRIKVPDPSKITPSPSCRSFYSTLSLYCS